MNTLNKFFGLPEPPAEKTQICKECNIDKPLSDYGKSNVFRHGSDKYYPNGKRPEERIFYWRVCKECRKQSALPSKIKNLYKKSKPLELKCPLCLKTDNDNPHNIHLDHCHKTQEVRGGVCMDCNVGMGHLKVERQSLEETKEHFNRILKWITPSDSSITQLE